MPSVRRAVRRNSARPCDHPRDYYRPVTYAIVGYWSVRPLSTRYGSIRAFTTTAHRRHRQAAASMAGAGIWPPEPLSNNATGPTSDTRRF
jgi:hypothetical protein